MKSVHSGRLERWLGASKVEELSRLGRGWYGPPIHLLDVPGSVRVCGDGDFIGPFERGYFASAADAIGEHVRRLFRSRATYGQLGAGFASVSDYLSRVAQGHRQTLYTGKVNTAPSIGNSFSMWNVTGPPGTGGAGSAAPGGRVLTSANTGALNLANPASGTMHLTGIDLQVTTGGESLLLYDRLFDVAKTMSSTATESVTGVPTRYQSTTVTAEDYIGGNFLFAEIQSTLGATAHNWTVCTYTDQANAASTLPSFAGVSAGGATRLDHPASQWFAPLESGDTGIKAITQLQCSASVTGTLNFVIGHPIGFIVSPLQYIFMPVEFVTSRQQAPRVFDNACLTFLAPPRPHNNNVTLYGTIEITTAAP